MKKKLFYRHPKPGFLAPIQPLKCKNCMDINLNDIIENMQVSYWRNKYIFKKTPALFSVDTGIVSNGIDTSDDIRYSTHYHMQYVTKSTEVARKDRMQANPFQSLLYSFHLIISICG